MSVGCCLMGAPPTKRPGRFHSTAACQHECIQRAEQTEARELQPISSNKLQGLESVSDNDLPENVGAKRKFEGRDGG